jgi:hypothetical protein
MPKYIQLDRKMTITDLSKVFRYKRQKLQKGQIDKMPILFNKLPFFLLFYKCIFLFKKALRVITKRFRKEKFS